MRVSPNLDLQALEAALNDLSRARVAMIGDLCLDLYIFGDMRLSELSRDLSLIHISEPTRPY